MLLIAAAGAAGPTLACLNDPTPRDASQVLSSDECGDRSWELQVQYGTLFDEGSADGSGTCAGNYYTCQCVHVNPTVKYALEGFRYSYIEAGTYDIWWDITNYDLPNDTYCNPTVECHDQAAVSNESVNSWIDYNEGYDEIQCAGQ